jgi:hypothetical protein
MRTYAHSAAVSARVSSSFSEIGGSRITPRSFCRSDEAPHAGDEVRFLAIAGMHDHFVLGVAHGIERTFHAVHDVLRVRVVVDQADQERLAEGEAARLRIRHVAELVDDRLDARARRSWTSGDWLMTRDTVFFETLASRAMSLMVALRPGLMPVTLRRGRASLGRARVERLFPVRVMVGDCTEACAGRQVVPNNQGHGTGVMGTATQRRLPMPVKIASADCPA